MQKNIFAQLSFSDLPLEEKLSLFQSINAWVQSEYLVRALQALTPDQIRAFIELSEKSENNEQVLLEYLEGTLLDTDQIFSESVEAVRQNISAQKIMSTLSSSL